MSLTDLFQTKSHKQSKELIAALSNPVGTVETVAKFIEAFDQKLVDYTRSKNDLPPVAKDNLAILDKTYRAFQKLQSGDGATFEWDVRAVLSYRSYDANNNTFGFADAAAHFLTEKRDTNGRCFAPQQADGIATFAAHLENYSLYIGSGNAGYSNMVQALAKYSQAAKAYDSFGQTAKGDEQAKKLEACAARQGHRLSESGQAWFDARFKKPAAGAATYG